MTYELCSTQLLKGTSVKLQSMQVALHWLAPYHLYACCSGRGGLACFCGSQHLERALHTPPPTPTPSSSSQIHDVRCVWILEGSPPPCSGLACFCGSERLGLLLHKYSTPNPPPPPPLPKRYEVYVDSCMADISPCENLPRSPRTYQQSTCCAHFRVPDLVGSFLSALSLVY